jgi:flagellar hook-associated protein FlgK
MIKQELIEQISRLVHNGFASDDSDVTDDLINLYVNQGIAIAVKNNYKEAIQLDGIGYVNNSFYSTFKGISIIADEQNLWELTLPSVPVAVGRNEGVSRLILKNSKGDLSYDCIPLSSNQLGFQMGMRVIPNKVLYYTEGGLAKIISSLNLVNYKASITMISGGNSTDMNSTLNIPNDAMPIVLDYCSKMLGLELNMKLDTANDGVQRP